MASRRVLCRAREYVPSLALLSSKGRAENVRRSGYAAVLALGTAVGVTTTAFAEVQPEVGLSDTEPILGRARDALRLYYEKKAQQVGVPVDTKKRKVPAKELFTDFNPQGNVAVRYVLIGGGTATYGALLSILKKDPAGTTLVVTEENMYPYNRTPLSKEAWRTGFRGVEELEYGYRVSESIDSRVSIAKGVRAESLDVDKKVVKLSSGIEVQYDKLLLATGGTPRLGEAIGPGLIDSPLVSTLRSVEDFETLKRATKLANHCSIVGAGFLGTELAVALNGKGVKITLVCPEPGVLYKVLPRYTSEFLGRKLREAGVDLHVGTAVGSVKSHRTDGDKETSDAASTKGTNDKPIEVGMYGAKGGQVTTQRVVVCVGIDPRVELAQGAGLETDSHNGGVKVDRGMRADENVYAAGDVASYYDRTLGRRRVEHWVCHTMLLHFHKSVPSSITKHPRMTVKVYNSWMKEI